MSDNDYYAKSLEVKVYPHLQLALDVLGDIEGRVAVDVGCGAGRDTLFLLEQGLTVHAYDKNEAAISFLHETGSRFLGEKLFTHVCSFEDFEYPQSSLVSACSSLFFCHPAVFPRAWRNIVDCLVAGGVFCGHFMGPNDSWAKLGRGDLTIHSRDQLEALFHDSFDIIDMVEWDEPGHTLLGKPKHWHTYSIVAQKV